MARTELGSRGVVPAQGTFVLVHGAWHGGWCWDRVAPLLRAAGWQVLAPSLTGLGARATARRRDVDLATHVRDVVDVIARETDGPVVLVGHSYAGLVITGAAERCAARLARLVYLDAAVSAHGRSAFDLRPRQGLVLQRMADLGGAGWLVPPPPAAALGLRAPDDVAWVSPRLVPHPLACFRQPLDAPTGAAATLPRTLVRCSGKRPVDLPEGVQERDLPVGHEAMVVAPARLAEVLLEVAGGAGYR